MGERIAEISVSTSTENERIGNGNGGSSGSTRTTDTETKGRTERTERTDNNGSGTDGNEEKEKIVSKVVDVIEEEKRAERNRKRREKYAREKAENGETVKPRKVNSRKKKSETNANTEQIKALLLTVSGVIASKENCAHWQLTPSEVESIANPLSNILANSKAFESMGEHADAIALVTACFTVLLPRIIITVSQNKAKKGVTKNVHNDIRKVDGTKGLDEKSKNNDSNNRDNRETTTDRTSNVKDESIFGVALT